MDYMKNAEYCIERAINKYVENGFSRRDAIYSVKRELAQLQKPLNATGRVKEAIDYIQKALNCTLDEALIKLKLMVIKL